MVGPRGIEEGDVIAGRYEVERLLGAGGMGAVYAARNQNSGRMVALKVIKAEVDPSLDQRRRFLREAKAATAIRHPNVIEVLDVFEDADGTLVMVMELLEGETLKDYRRRAGAVTLHEAARIFVPVAEALAAAHGRGIVHRDLKPENIFLAEKDGQTVPTVVDFGIAKVLDPKTLSGETHGQETATGSLLGTPHYMSYEQAMSDKDIDQRADVWAVGVMLFELMTGRRPIEFENLGEMYTAFITGTVPSIRDWVVDLPADAAEVVDRCLVKQRAGRLDDLAPLVEVLRRYLDPEAPGGTAGGVQLREPPRPAGTPLGPTPSSTASLEGFARGPERPSRWSWAAAAVAIAGGVAATVFLVTGPRDETSDGAELDPVRAGEIRDAEPSTSALATPTAPVAQPGDAGEDAEAETMPLVASPEAADTAGQVAPPAGAMPPTGPPIKPRLEPASAERPEPPPPPPPEPRRPGLAEEDPYAGSG